MRVSTVERCWLLWSVVAVSGLMRAGAGLAVYRYRVPCSVLAVDTSIKYKICQFDLPPQAVCSFFFLFLSVFARLSFMPTGHSRSSDRDWQLAVRRDCGASKRSQTTTTT